MSSATVLNDVTTGTAPLQTITTRLAATTAQMAGPGVPCLWFTRENNEGHGVPLSRASEYTARDADVIQESPQNHIAMEARAAMALPNFAPSAICRTAIAAGTTLP